VPAGKYYIISTGGASGAFTCGSSSGFLEFVQSYYTSHMLGVAFDTSMIRTVWPACTSGHSIAITIAR
jgi:hypothetical protein